jgi:hypothetical protein
MVIGLENEEEKRHLLGRAKELRNTRYSDISIVPDLTRKQRNREARMKEEAEEKNKELTEEERRRNVKWMVVGRRGEKRIIKGVERDQQPYTREGRRDEPSRNNGPRSSQSQARDEQRESRTGEGSEQRRGGLLPPIQQREQWRPEQREGTWYRKEQEQEGRELGARSKTHRPENRGAGAQDQQERSNSGRWEGNNNGRDRRHSKRTRWSNTSSEEETQPRSRQRQ